MRIAHVSALESFGTRSLAVHATMVVTFASAILVGLFVGGQLGLVSFVALLNFTAGLWVAHSIHSLGNAVSDDEYAGVLNELLDSDSEDVSSGLDTGRFGRLLGLIAAVTAISLLTSAQILSGTLFSVAVVAVGTIALVTAIVGFLIAMGASYDETQQQVVVGVDPTSDTLDVD